MRGAHPKERKRTYEYGRKQFAAGAGQAARGAFRAVCAKGGDAGGRGARGVSLGAGTCVRQVRAVCHGGRSGGAVPGDVGGHFRRRGRLPDPRAGGRARAVHSSAARGRRDPLVAFRTEIGARAPGFCAGGGVSAAARDGCDDGADQRLALECRGDVRRRIVPRGRHGILLAARRAARGNAAGKRRV